MIPITSSLQGYPFGFKFQGNDMHYKADQEDTNSASPAYFIPLTSTQYYHAFQLYGMVAIPQSGTSEIPEYQQIGFAIGGFRDRVQYNGSGAKEKLRLI